METVQVLDNGWRYADLIRDMLSLVPDDVDKREGSIMYNTLAPTAYFLSRQNFMLGFLMALSLFADTAEGEWLDRVTNDFGVNREQATQALRQINTFDTKNQPYDIPVGTRFAIDEVTFKLTEKITTGQYKALCEQTGTIGNWPRQALLPVDNIGGNFGYAELVSDPLIPARDTETDDSLRERFYLYVRAKPYGGNKADYKLKVMEIEGVGDVAVFGAPVMGPGQVGIIITDDLGQPAEEELLDRVRVQVSSQGNGIAPIGHQCTVGTVMEKTIDLEATLKLRDSAQFELVKPKVEQAVADYIAGIGFEDDTVFYSKVIAAILDADLGIRDATDVKLNGKAANVSLLKEFDAFQVAKLGTVTLKEMEDPDGVQELKGLRLFE